MAKKPATLLRKIVRTSLLLVALYLGACFALARLYLHPSRTRPMRPTGIYDTVYRDLPLWQTKGLHEGKPSPTVFVFAHGYGGDRSQWSELMPELQKRGFDSVAIAMPGQDSNPDDTVGFGFKEASAVSKASGYVRMLGAQHVVLCGVSLGGSACWLAGEECRPDAIVSEGAFSRFDRAMNHWLDAAVPYGSVVLKPVVWFASWQSGIDPGKIVPGASAEHLKGMPALVIEGGADDLVPIENAKDLAAASGAELWIVPKAKHAQCYFADSEEYVAKLIGLADGVNGPTRK